MLYTCGTFWYWISTLVLLIHKVQVSASLLVTCSNFLPIHFNLLSRFKIFCSLTITQSNKQKQNLLGRGSKELLQSSVYGCEVAFTTHTVLCWYGRERTLLIDHMQDASQHRCHSEKLQLTARRKEGPVIHDWIDCHAAGMTETNLMYSA